MTFRSTMADAFLAETDWADCIRKPLAGDASNRRYERLQRESGESAVLMDAPPDKGEDVEPFIRIARHLYNTGLSAPRIFAQNLENGFLLLEDLGDDLFARVLVSRPELESELYAAATDVLITLHGAELPELDSYDPGRMTDLAALAFDWYQRGAAGMVDSGAKAQFKSEFARGLAKVVTGPPVLIQRDYHAENLLWLPDRTDVARVGLLDFQDAMAGHPAYDLVSLLQDARRDVPPAIEAAMLNYYIRRTGVESHAFKTSYCWLGVQRNLRILGVFSRLCLLGGKAQYVDLIPRVWELVLRDLEHSSLSGIKPVILKSLPAPDADILTRLKDQCATHLPQ